MHKDRDWLSDLTTPNEDDRPSTGPLTIQPESKDTELASQFSEDGEQYRSLVSNTVQIFWTTDAMGNCGDDMRIWRTYTGQSQEEVAGRGWFKAVHPDDQEYVVRTWHKALVNKGCFEIEYRLRRYDGVYRMFEVRGIPVFEPDGSIRGWVGASTDITERKQMEAERQQLEHKTHDVLKALGEANKRMDEFLSIASHELRTPLTTISVQTQIANRRLKKFLQEEHASVEDLKNKIRPVQEILCTTHQHIELLNRLVGDLIDLSRIQVNKLNLYISPKPCDLTQIVRDVVESHRQIVPSRDIHLELLDPSTDTPSPATGGPAVLVYADSARIIQVITNYLTNALKYSPANRPVTISIKVENSMAIVSVHDEGSGLSADEQERIWERFYQTGDLKTRHKTHVGLGLGLYISRSIILQHHGQVGVQSIPGRGSIFWFSLPLVESAPNA